MSLIKVFYYHKSTHKTGLSQTVLCPDDGALPQGTAVTTEGRILQGLTHSVLGAFPGGS